MCVHDKALYKSTFTFTFTFTFIDDDDDDDDAADDAKLLLL